MVQGLDVMASRCELPARVDIDVDSDPVLSRRYGLKVPVLLLDGVPVCQVRLDPVALERRLDRR